MEKRWRIFTIMLAVALSGVLVVARERPSEAQAPAATPKQAPASSPLRDAPLMLIENVGQFPEGARFKLGGGGSVWVADHGLWLTVMERRAADVPEGLFRGQGTEQPETERVRAVNLKVSFVGANPHPLIEPLNPLAAHVSYLIGHDPDQWHADVPVWGGVRYVDLYPGVDLEITGEGGGWAWRAVGEDESTLSQMRLRIEGADSLTVVGGRVQVNTAAGTLSVPLLQLEMGGGPRGEMRHPPRVEGNEIASPFEPGNIATDSAPSSLAADPYYSDHLVYSTWLGGEGDEEAHAVAARQVWDSEGDGLRRVYFTGVTNSLDFPVSWGAYDVDYNGGWDVFVAKFGAEGPTVGGYYITYLGGGGTDHGHGVAVDRSGNAYVTGWTSSSDFPTTPDACSTQLQGTKDAFVVKLSDDGTALHYATYLGGDGDDDARDIALWRYMSEYYPFMTGRTESPGLSTEGPGYAGEGDGYLAILNPSGTQLLAFLYLGGGSDDSGDAISVASDFAYVTGWTSSSDFPTTEGAYQETYGGILDAFVVQVGIGDDRFYSTFLGGSSADAGFGIAVDDEGNACVTGGTMSDDFPTTPRAFDRYLNVASDAFVVQLDPRGDGEVDLLWSTFLGGHQGGETEEQWGTDIAADEGGLVYVTGLTDSPDFPHMPWSYQVPPPYGGLRDAFVMVLEPGAEFGAGVAYATELGGSGNDEGYSIAELEGRVYVVGRSASDDFPTAGSWLWWYTDGYDAFFSVLSPEQPDLGFRPDPDGYSFENWQSQQDDLMDEFGADDLVTMFGSENVCVWVDAQCEVRELPLHWWTYAVSQLYDGHCAGMSATTLRFFEGAYPRPGFYQDGAEETHDLDFGSSADTPIRGHIAFYHMIQATEPYVRLENSLSFDTDDEILNNLRVAMSGEVSLEHLVVQQRNPFTGEVTSRHAVVPYRIERGTEDWEGMWKVFVYDPNHPDDNEQVVALEPTSDIGDRGLVPIAWYDLPVECHFCQAQAASVGASSEEPSIQVWLQGDGHLLIGDTQGRRIGYVGDQLVNEIPEAYYNVPAAQPGHVLEPVYYLPRSDRYTIRLDGQTLSQAGTAGFAQFGPGYAGWAESIHVEPSSLHVLKIASDGTLLFYSASPGGQAALGLALEEASESLRLEVKGADVAGDRYVSLFADRESGQMVFSSADNIIGGEYDPEVTRISTAGEHSFAHIGVSILAGDTHYLDYGSWDGSGGMTLGIDHGSDGTIDETTELTNDLLPRVLFDEAHAERNTLSWERAQILLPDHPDWIYFGALADALDDEFTLERNGDGMLSSALLRNYSALILAAPEEALDPAEVDAVTQFVRRGGGLILLGDCGLDHPGNAFSGSYDINFDEHCIYEPIPDLNGDVEVSAFADHPAVTGVTRMIMNWGQSLTVGGSAEGLSWTSSSAWQDTNWSDAYDPGDSTGPFTIAAAYDTGFGRVAAVSDNSFQDDGFEWRTNDVLMRSLLRWVTGGQSFDSYLPLVLRGW
jgi:hypothetical protein